MRIRESLENLFYKKIVRNLLLLSNLGRRSATGEAATGYNFDYMYENKAHGFFGIGLLIDKILLNLPAVQATRNRRSNIVKILSNEIQNNKLKGKTTRILDLACGAGRYLNDIARVYPNDKVEIVGVDLDNKSLELAKSLSEKEGVTKDQIRFIKGNVFKLSILKKLGKHIEWRPNIVIASGLTVYIDDDKVINMIKQIYDGLDKNGLVLIDSQESNPSRKLMEKALKTKEGAWTLYYRPAEQWRQWLNEFGFQNIVVSRDPWQMYNICSARKS
jgi:SAM-dependent methyltransferase